MQSPAKHSSNKKRIIQSGIGFCSGIIVSGMFQPLKVFKMTIILSPKIKGSVYEKLSKYTKIVVDQHGFKGFWNGLTPAIIKNSIGNILFFLPLRVLEQKFALTPFVASSLARMVSCASINPLSVLQTRFVVPGPRKHNNVIQAVKTLYHKQGFRVFWKGLVPSCLKQGIFAGIYYTLYKRTQHQYFGIKSTDNFLSGIFSGGCATIISHPLQIVRARIQSGTGFIYSRLLDGLKQIYINQGLSGFMKGVTPRLAKKPLINTTTFLVFQSIQRFALDRMSDKFQY